MDEKGYVVCLLKYMMGTEIGDSESWNRQSGNAKPICFGYFGRADVVPVRRFKDYMRIASENDAEFIGSRKQLLMYSLSEELSGQIKLYDPNSAPEEKNCLPFRPAEGDSRPALCCLSVLKIDNDVKKRLGTNWLRTVAQGIFQQIEEYKTGEKTLMPCAVMGLLGTEDLCVILLSDSFEKVSGAVDRLRGLVERNSKTVVVENSHSVLMVDFSGQAAAPDWSGVNAEIHVSLKTKDGGQYLEKVRAAIASQPGNPATSLESRPGEYDALIRCPASALGSYLYGYGNLLNYVTLDYRKAAYQSETVLSCVASPLEFVEIEFPEQVGQTVCQPSEYNPEDEDMKQLVDRAARQITKCVLGTEEDPKGDTAYIRLGLYRLLKDFMRVASLPFGGTLGYDLQLQFQGAVNAIIYAAGRYEKEKSFGKGAKGEFDRTFSEIMNAISNSVLAASQIDQLCFEEQQSHLQNTGAYHKILQVYYGLVKDILQLIYSIPRTKDNREPLLIPLLSFGHTPIIFSKSYQSYFHGEAANLVCITLPYQALGNIPKYIGILLHELFHYSIPADRNGKNRAAGLCLAAVALRQFINEVGANSPNPFSNAGDVVFSRYQQEFLAAAKMMFGTIQNNQNRQLQSGVFCLKLPDYEETVSTLSSVPFFKTVREGLLPTVGSSMGGAVEELYCQTWLFLRKKLLEKQQDKGYISLEISNLFSLQSECGRDKAYAYIHKMYRQTLPHARQKIRGYLDVYEKVLREVPPDLFDVGFVMCGQEADLRARQYLWQIHGSRSDKLYYSNVSQSQPDGNTIRIGIVLDYLVFGLFEQNHFTSYEERKRQIDNKIQQWFDGQDATWTEEWETLRRYTDLDYEGYASESLFAGTLLQNYIKPIADQIHKLTESEKTRLIIECLSGFYSKYCQAQEGKPEEQPDTLFALSLQMIEHYQLQPTLLDLCKIRRQGPVLTDNTPEKELADCSTVPGMRCVVKALHPRDLSKQIVEVYNIMIPNGASSPLWFRGEGKVDNKILPGIMRKKETYSEYGFITGMRKMLTLAKAKILPQGARFHKAEWLAFLQHNGFKTNLLDWSEDMHSALFFAIEKWIEDINEAENGDAAIYVLNPILFNLARDLLEKDRKKTVDKDAKESFDKALKRLCRYLECGSDESGSYAIPLFTAGEEPNEDEYSCYYDLMSKSVSKDQVQAPIAAMTPANSDRMKMQAGVFTFFDVRSRPENKDGQLTYEDSDLFNIQDEYYNVVVKNASVYKDPRPFLCKIILNHYHAKDFVKYVRAVGIRKYKMYPEIDKLADDIKSQAF